MGGINAYSRPDEAIRSVRFAGRPARAAALRFVEGLYEKGYYAVKDSYVLGDSTIALNRSRGAESNFFVFIRPKGSRAEVFFTDPRDTSDAVTLQRGGIIVRRELEASAQASDVLAMTLNLAGLKYPNHFYCNFHSHLGSINGEGLWDDAITRDIDWIGQSMMWNIDVHALTPHNWTQKRKLLRFLDRHCANANIVLVPGWENTTTVDVKETVRAPHLLVYCADIDTAWKAKEEFLAKKLDKPGVITPILGSVPVPFDEHINFITGPVLRAAGKAALIFAHPASTLPGIDLLDPANVNALGGERIWKLLFEIADGVEQYNFSDSHCEIDFDLTDGKIDGKSAFADELRAKMRQEGLKPILSPAMINYCVGRIAKREYDRITTAAPDDHSQPPLSPDNISDYAMGHTRLELGERTMEILRRSCRKPTSAEIVASMIGRKFPLAEEPVKFAAVLFARKKGDTFEIPSQRRPTRWERIRGWFREDLPQLWRYVKLQGEYMFSRIMPDWIVTTETERMIAEEREKARACRSRI